jgi:D-alanyl-D-alanine carboxypeptidase
MTQFDGSGLSRQNQISADTLVSILAHLARDSELPGPFLEALPIAGIDGTLDERLRAQPTIGNVRAKTGTKNHVRTLAGYLTSRNGDRLAFAIAAPRVTRHRDFPASRRRAGSDTETETLQCRRSAAMHLGVWDETRNTLSSSWRGARIVMAEHPKAGARLRMAWTSPGMAEQVLRAH